MVRADALMRFLKSRCEDKGVERTIRIDNPQLVRILRERAEPKYWQWPMSPWDRDRRLVMHHFNRSRGEIEWNSCPAYFRLVPSC
jgi:hypothetical protein